ncbi:murein hydrolase activator NlpD [Photorhabdus namnaonensis]|uniref:Murein hydrolase activator NlpD n=1 Tax=Photorhabdus namnaonensis TaxID=1851568 RepID=A0A1B8YIQ6_9GAMM|nr:Murein hydrolase activator NlpD precursor [Photorhabdus namnaonensis]
MNSGSPMKKIQRIVTCLLMGVWLVGCTNTPTRPAPITSIDQKQSRGSSHPVIYSGNSAISTPMPSSPSSMSATDSDSPGRIVYNRDYDSIPKGSYNSSAYTVKHGDTLFYIAWITGNDFRDLASKNNISEPYSLTVGQTLRTSNSGMLTTHNHNQMQTALVDSQSTNAYPANSGIQKSVKMLPRATTSTVNNTYLESPTTTASSGNSVVSSWMWPAEGKMIESFSDTQGGNKGIDIAGGRGQSVFATAGGRVVYAGNALRGYGNLIIIKHNDDYLSAYAHNDTMLVREQQDIKAGQKIATMGSTGTSSVRLHFEIRYKGKSVNPLRYLPQR